MVEYLRKRIKGFHIAYDIESVEFCDEYEPLEEGLDRVTIKRKVATLIATGSLKGDDLKKKIGYMAPLPDNELLNQEQFKKEVEEHQFRKDEENKDG